MGLFVQDHLLALPAGYRLRQYEIVKMLGAGGFGITYLAHDTTLDRTVAIKEYLPSDVALRTSDSHVTAKSSSSNDDFHWGLTRFLEEARILAKFRHRNIVEVIQIFEANQTAYIVMDFIEGDSLSAAIERDAPMREPDVRKLMGPMLEGLKRVHELGFLHRDIKPGNIILRANGDPVLIDFGAARQALEAKSRSLTSVVTEGYAPIEQYASSGNQGPWTDMYALAAVAYKCFTGRTPVAATMRLRNDPLEPLEKVAAARASESFLRAIDWALAPDERDRPQTIDQWVASFDPNAQTSAPQTQRTEYVRPPERTIFAPPGHASVPAPQPPSSDLLSRLPRPVLYGGAAAAAMVAIFLTWFLVINRASPEDAQAWANAAQANTIQSYEAYLRIHEDGFYVRRASERVQTLMADQDNAAWQTASNANTIDAYQLYVSNNPKGAHVQDAQSRVTQIREQAAIAGAQQVLQRLRLYNGPADGVMRPELATALRSYQQSKGIAQTGTITPELMRSMSADLAAIERQKLAAAREAAREAAEQAARERSAYSSATSRRERSGYEAFLASYPNSQYAPDVRSRMSSCRTESRAINTPQQTSITGRGIGNGASDAMACRVAENNASNNLRTMCSGGRITGISVDSNPTGGGGVEPDVGQVFTDLFGGAVNGRRPTFTGPPVRRSAYTCAAVANAQCERNSREQRSIEVCR